MFGTGLPTSTDRRRASGAIAEERVREDVGEHEPLLGDVVEKRDADLVVDRLLGLIQVDLLLLVTEDLASLRGESIRFF